MAIQTFDTFQNDPVLRDIAERREKFRLDIASARHTAIRRAKAEEKIETLLKLLEWNIETPSESLRSRIKQLTDYELLAHLFEMVGKHQVNTIEEFEELLP